MRLRRLGSGSRTKILRCSTDLAPSFRRLRCNRSNVVRNRRFWKTQVDQILAIRAADCFWNIASVFLLFLQKNKGVGRNQTISAFIVRTGGLSYLASLISWYVMECPKIPYKSGIVLCYNRSSFQNADSRVLWVQCHHSGSPCMSCWHGLFQNYLGWMPCM